MATVEGEPQLLDFFPSRLRETGSAYDRDQLAEKLASVVGKETMTRLGADIPTLTTAAPAPPPPPWVHSLIGGEGRRTEPASSPYVEWKVKPFRVPETITHHGGNMPQVQAADARPDGSLLIQTIIGQDSSQLETQVFVGCGPLLAVFDNGVLRVSPRLIYQAWHALYAYGFTDGSHSVGRIGTVLCSKKLDGTDWKGEDVNEMPVWDSRAGGGSGHQTGHWVTEDPNTPDEVASVSIGQLSVDARMATDRRYFAYAYLFSQSDADGHHDYYGSHAAVYFRATVDEFLARQWSP